MNYTNTSYLLAIYGGLLLTFAVLAYFYSGAAAGTTMIIGFSGGLVALTAGHFLKRGQRWAFYLGLIQTLVLLPLTGWLTAVSFMRMPLLLPSNPVAYMETLVDVRLLGFIFGISLMTALILLVYARRILKGLGENDTPQ